MGMRTLPHALLAGLLTLVTSGQTALAVIGGTVDTQNRFPNVGAYVIVSDHGVPLDEPWTLCSGTLVHPRVFLTAGHATSQIEAVIGAGLSDLGDARVSFGTDPLDPSTWLEIEEIVTHPDYGQNGIVADEADVGVVVLKEPVVGVEPVTLAPVGFLNDLRKSGALRERATRLTVVGYGMDRVFPPARAVPSDGLRRFAEVVFGGVTAKWVSVQQNPVAHEGGVLYGDSGGPIFWTDPATGKVVQVGITSWAIDAALARFVRVDLPTVRGFIDAVVEDVEEADAR
jgi:V8-like Glu-specific endopeptidase